MKKYNLSKIYDDSFKKGILDIIKQGMPEGGVYSSSEKPPEGAQVYRTDRGTEYWIPSKKDEPKTAKIKTPSLKRSKTTSMSDIKSIANEQGYSWFDKDTMKYFNSKIESPLYEKDGKKYFITSERYDDESPRKYSVRQIEYYDKKGNPAKSGKLNVSSVGEGGSTGTGFQEHDSLQAAKNALAGTKGKAKEDIPETGREQFTDKQRKSLSDESYDSYENLSADARELHIMSDNDPDIYRQRLIPIRENLKKKMKKGIYERSKAEKLAKYLMDDVSKKYQKDFGTSFTPDQRREAAAHWVKDFEDNYAFGEYD